MGKYVNITSTGIPLPSKGKAQALVEDGAIVIPEPEEWREGIICVVDNDHLKLPVMLTLQKNSKYLNDLMVDLKYGCITQQPDTSQTKILGAGLGRLTQTQIRDASYSPCMGSLRRCTHSVRAMYVSILLPYLSRVSTPPFALLIIKYPKAP